MFGCPERILAQTERPADIVRRRLDQAGYDIADGLDLLGADDIQFLMKFVYKSNVLGPAVSVHQSASIGHSDDVAGGGVGL